MIEPSCLDSESMKCETETFTQARYNAFDNRCRLAAAHAPETDKRLAGKVNTRTFVLFDMLNVFMHSIAL